MSTCTFPVSQLSYVLCGFHLCVCVCVCACSESLQRRVSEVEGERTTLQQQLVTSDAARETTETALKASEATCHKLQQECNELKQTCVEFKGEVNSLLADLQEQGVSIRGLEEERDALREQVWDSGHYTNI